MNYEASLVILSHNKVDYTRRCLESLLATSAVSFEIIVVDNGSKDGTLDWLKGFDEQASKKGVGFQLISNEGNAGCSTARNQGIDAAQSSRIAFLDNDTELRQKSWLRVMLDRLNSSDEFGMIGPKLLYPFEPYNIQCAGAAVSKSGRVQFMGRGESRDSSKFNVFKEVQCLISACYLVKKEVLQKAGGFEEVYNPVEYEDIDHSYKIREAGFKAIYEPQAEIYHFENVTTEGTPRLPNKYLIIKNGMEFKRRWAHRFSKEEGPSDEETKWKTIDPIRLDQIQNLEIID